MDGSGFASVIPGRIFSFPADLGPHPDYRIEWWYVTANLADSTGVAYGAQWTLFRQASRPGAQQQGWASQQIWMGHAAVTRADTHRFSETFARGGVGQAGVEAKPYQAWIDSWQMRGLDRMDAIRRSPRSNSTHRAPISVTRCVSTPIGPWFCRAMRVTAENRNADRPRIISASLFSRRPALSSSTTSLST